MRTNIRIHLYIKPRYEEAVNSPPVPHRDVNGASTMTYRLQNDDYATTQRQIERPIQPEIEVEQRTKKDKKWSIGKLFRRKKKGDDSITSTESDEGISTHSPSKKKSKKKKRIPAVNNFDHIVIRDTRRAQSLAKPSVRDFNDDGILSDPSAGFVKHGINLQKTYEPPKDSSSLRDDYMASSTKISLETPSKKKRKGRLKARVEALRNSMKGDSSSDEESLKSSNSSSIVRFRSDESLMRSRDSSLNKRSRSARNERYIKRLSRDEENQLNKEAELIQQGYTKAEVDMLTRTPTSQSSGYGTCKREHNNQLQRENLNSNESNNRALKSESISSFPSTKSYPSSINFNAKVNNDHINYSIQYGNNINNREPYYSNNNRERNLYHNENVDGVMCVKFPLGNMTNMEKADKSPPVPPPRDMQRKVTSPLPMYHENKPVISEQIGNKHNVLHGVPNNDFERVMRRSQERIFGHLPNGLCRPISTSEDHIALEKNELLYNNSYKHEQPKRPASVSAEPNHYSYFGNMPIGRKRYEANIFKTEPIQVKQDYLYYADQSPRSRRPISIKSSQSNYEHQYLSDSQASLNIPNNTHRKPRNATEFWRKLDNDEKQKKKQNYFCNARSNGEQIYNSSFKTVDQNKLSQLRTQTTNIQNKNSVGDKLTDRSNMWKSSTEYKRAMTVEPQNNFTTSNSRNPTRNKSDTFVPSVIQNVPSDDENNSERRKSTNLDDALNELEAIYNSLGLGDEDLLDRAERRELMTPKLNENFNDWNGNDDYLHLRSQPITPLKRKTRRSTLPDKLQDDMAFRRLNSFSKEKTNLKEAQAQISYMLASPVYVPYMSDDDRTSEKNEPDIVHDDVVYRNIKQINNRLKVIDPQPPFGIPVGPVSPAPQSDYLHATPENKIRSRFVPRKSPDLVADDLAYRSLRKDNRHSSLFKSDEINSQINNNYGYSEYPCNKESAANLKKKRAIRSLSANIFTMIQREIDEALNMGKMATIQKTHSNSDVLKKLKDHYEDNEEIHHPRNKVMQRHNTINLLVDNTHNCISHFAKDDSFLCNDDKCYPKPSSCDKSKSSSPLNRSPQNSKRSSRNEFQQVLSMLAQEAMDTSNKLGVALAELDKNRNNKVKKSDFQSRISDSRSCFLNGLTNKSNENTEIKLVNVDSERVNKSNMNDPLTLSQEQSKAKKTEDSLLAISNQLNRVEDQLKYSYEKELDLNKTINTFNNEPNDEKKVTETIEVFPEIELFPKVTPMTIKNDSITVKNLNWNFDNCRSKMQEQQKEKKSLNPFLNNVDDKLQEINEINAFKELKEGISDLIAGISQVNDKLCIPTNQEIKNNDVSNKITGISEASEQLNLVSLAEKKKSDDLKRSSVNLSIYEDDLDIKKNATDSTEYNSSDELATIFCKPEHNVHMSTILRHPRDDQSDKNVRCDLSSPKLVKTVNQHLRRMSLEQPDECISTSSQSNATNLVSWRNRRQNHNSPNDNKGSITQTKRSWHDSGTLMLACSYTIMLQQQLADLDWLTLFGLLLAIITIIAMLLL